MRRTLQGLTLAAAATVTVLATTAAAPAYASVVRCSPQHIFSRPDVGALPVLVSACGEAEGTLKRGTSTLVNLSNQPVSIQDLRTLISFPAYGDKDCGSVLLGPAGTPSASATCVSPWVSDGPTPTSDALIFTLCQAFMPDGRFITDTSNFRATF
jgi:hypothetical protein